MAEFYFFTCKTGPDFEHISTNAAQTQRLTEEEMDGFFIQTNKKNKRLIL